MMSKQSKRPPRFAEWLLTKLANNKAESIIIGDLEEEYNSAVEIHGETHALFWYWKSILFSIPSFLKNKLCWNMAMLKNYLRIALRNILRNKLFAFVNILGLAVGIACFILISLWVQDELSYDKFHVNKDRLHLLTIEHPNGIIDPNVPYALAPIMASEFPEIVKFTRIYELGYTSCSFKYQREDGRQVMYYEDNVNLVDPSFFSMFTFPFSKGNPETALQERNSLVITEKIAEKYFGRENPLGKKLTFNNKMDLTVSGVVHVPSNSYVKFDFLAHLQNDLSNDWNWRDPSFILLNTHVSVEDFRKKISGSLNKHCPDRYISGAFKVDILPITECHLHFGRMTYVYIFSIIAIFILFIACINYMNLSTASSSSRAKEVGLRKVVGAKRTQLIYQFLGESTLISAFALVLSLLLAYISVPLLNSLTSKQMTLFPFMNNHPYLLLLGLVIVVGLISGCYPALFLSTSKPVNTLKATQTFRANRSPFRIITVIGQFTISVFLIVCSMVVFKQLHYVRNRPLGFKTDYVLKIPFNESLRKSFPSFKNELLQNPNISYVTASQAIPYDEDYKTQGIEWDKKDPTFIPTMRYSITDYDYIELYEMQIEEGRSFSKDHPGDRYNYIINQSAAKSMGMNAPIGKRLKLWGQEGQIIGVVKDFHHVSLHRKILPHIFSINPNFFSSWLKYISIKINSTNIADTVKHIETTSKKFAPNSPFQYSFLDEGMGNLYQTEQRLGRIFGYFAFLAIFISCLGIFGLSAFSTEQRTKEIGIRKVLGSSASGIVTLLSKDFSRWIILANIVAWPLAYYGMNRWLQSFAYRTGLNPSVFLLAGLLSFVIAALPVTYQSLKIATANPAEALKYE